MSGKLYLVHLYYIVIYYIICRYELCGCEVIWAIKDSSIGNTFFDEGAAKFFLPHLTTPHHTAPLCAGEGEGGDDEMIKTKPLKRMRYMLDPIGIEKLLL